MTSEQATAQTKKAPPKVLGPIRLTTHPGQPGVHPTPLKWGARTSAERGPVVVRPLVACTVQMRSGRSTRGSALCAGDELTTRPPQLHRQSLGCACHRSFPLVPACCREPGGHRLACAGAYAIYRAVAKAAGSMAQDFKTDLTNTEPAVDILPNEAWYDTDKVCRCQSRRRDQCRRVNCGCTDRVA